MELSRSLVAVPLMSLACARHEAPVEPMVPAVAPEAVEEADSSEQEELITDLKGRIPVPAPIVSGADTGEYLDGMIDDLACDVNGEFDAVDAVLGDSEATDVTLFSLFTVRLAEVLRDSIFIQCNAGEGGISEPQVEVISDDTVGVVVSINFMPEEAKTFAGIDETRPACFDEFSEGLTAACDERGLTCWGNALYMISPTSGSDELFDMIDDSISVLRPLGMEGVEPFGDTEVLDEILEDRPSVSDWGAFYLYSTHHMAAQLRTYECGE